VKRLFRLLLVPLAFAACGKKSEPLPPVPPLPARTTDLKVEQQGETAELSFSFPSQRMDGALLTDLDAVEIYRIAGPGASLTAPILGAIFRPAGSAAALASMIAGMSAALFVQWFTAGAGYLWMSAAFFGVAANLLTYVLVGLFSGRTRTPLRK